MNGRLWAVVGLAALWLSPSLAADSSVDCRTHRGVRDCSVKYVSPRGSDSAAGSFASPWRTVQRALGAVRPGDVVYVRAGVYGEKLTALRGGTAAAVVTVRAYPGERPVVTGRLKIVGSYMRFAGFVFEGRTAVNPSDVAVYVSGADHVEISGNEIRNSAMSGIYVGDTGNGADFLRILGNYIHDNGTHWNLDHGIYFGHGRNGLVANNVVERNFAYGLKLAPEANQVVATQNTVVTNGRSGVIVGGDLDQTSNGNLVVNNIVAFNKAYGIRTYWAGAVGTGNTATRNLLWSNEAGSFLFLGGGMSETESMTTNPLFEVAGGGDYSLQSGSVALDAAKPEYSMSADYRSMARTVPEVGAYER